MPEPLLFTVTRAGRDALVDAENGETEAIRIVELGLSDQPVVVAPTLEALPGEFKRLDTLSGESASATIIHMSAVDGTDEVYDVHAVGLFLEDGTLFAAYSAGEALIFRKVDIAAFLFSVDILFSEAVAGDIEFGAATFLFPPATETRKGVAEIASHVETLIGTDDQRIVTPFKLKTLLDSLFATVDETIGSLTTTVNAALAALNDTVNALLARTITGGGLVTGGGDLTANRTLTVTAATGADVATGTEAGKAVTPAAIGGMPQTWNSVRGLGGALTKHGTVSVAVPSTTSVTFPVAFPTACDRVLISPCGDPDNADEDDETWWVTSESQTGFSIETNGDGNTLSFAWVAYGH